MKREEERWEKSRGSSFQAIAAQTKAVVSSTSGYWSERRLLQPRHLLRWTIKLKSGMSSNQRSCLPHERQSERPCSFFAPYRSVTTFKKLPTIAPNAKKKKRSVQVIVSLYHAKTAPIAVGTVLRQYRLVGHIVFPRVSIGSVELCPATPR